MARKKKDDGEPPKKRRKVIGKRRTPHPDAKCPFHPKLVSRRAVPITILQSGGDHFMRVYWGPAVEGQPHGLHPIEHDVVVMSWN